MQNKKQMISDEDLKNSNVDEFLSQKEAHLYEQPIPPQPTYQKPESPQPSMSLDWKIIAKDRLPSQGLFYTDDTVIQMKPVSFEGIVHFSNMNEEDFDDKEARINKLFEECLRITQGGRPLPTKELVTKDKLTVILAIRDYTFSTYPNDIIVPCNCPIPSCNAVNKVGINSMNTVFFEASEYFQKNYNPNTKSVKITDSKGNVIDFYFPKIGTEEVINRYIENKLRKGQKVNSDYLKIILHTLPDWKGVTDITIEEKMLEIRDWTLEMLSLYIATIEDFKKATISKVIFDCSSCGASEVSANYTFPGKLRHLFLVQSALGRVNGLPSNS